jgi:hypothetical protein
LVNPLVHVSGPLDKIVDINIYDLSGRVIASRFDKSRKVIEFSANSRGIYIIRLTTPEKVFVERLILR